MKRFLLFILLAVAVKPASAQFTVSALGNGYTNIADFFGSFRDYYNTVNAADLTNNMGTPSKGIGYSYELGYRLLRISTSIRRTHLMGRTHATFSNNAKRMVKYQYMFTNINIGYFHPGERNEFIAEIGMTHSLSSLYSYINLPNGQTDFFAGGVSQQSTWVQIGMNIRFSWHRMLTENLWFCFDFNGIRVNNDKEPAPRLQLDQAYATHSITAATLGIGLIYHIGERIE